MTRLVLAVDGGNSKTDVALVDPAGTLLSWVRGPGCALDVPAVAALIARLADAAAASAGVALADAHAACYLAGVDVPWQASARREALASLGVFGSVEVGNDAWALLRLGASSEAPAVGVVCGAGLKGVARSGSVAWEFPSLGWQTGDLSGAGDFLARETVRVAARAEDGRGPSTPLREAVCSALGVPSVHAVGERLLAGSLTEEALGVLVPVVLDQAVAGDPVAAGVVGELAAEVAAMARAARRTLGGEGPWTLVLGGGLFADPAGRLLSAVRKAAPELEREFALAVVDAPPVAGAALLGLDRTGAAAGVETVRRAFLTRSPSDVIDLR
ncbi:N-acetylglucosamine kinase [Actinoallomurus iriomotensis]|uniref:N-acetylglucosamine kinase n=1 Tax=Actinoallomurus iriomotensis TaxID=478107 RepID=A0A9W6RNK7_9ACTN|nr:BadF/BadG/BcrA/BcrD ATPase family protein [Actinoallomurus iriomotensis]GLY78933.1 N-acetylglucosamine kinase [Actinoallomurus iriomotensis]